MKEGIEREVKDFKEKLAEIEKKYNIDFLKLQREQLKLAKSLKIKDEIDFELADRVAGIDNTFFKNNIISAVVVLAEGEVVEQEYSSGKIKFPYVAGFRAYRELESMISAFNKLDEKPDVVFVSGHGILHSRGLGLASHFSLATGVPTIGVSDSLLVGEIQGNGIFLDTKLVGTVIYTKKGARPLCVSPGNLISVSTSEKLTRKFTMEPHKYPEPLRLAKKYAREIRKELFKV
ncbi:MAG: endonuclease V [Nanoarchaeota archaeon]